MVREMDFVDECYADKDLSLLKKLTLVIPTYNRNYYLSRCLWYHAHFPFGQIIVADSSPEEKKVVNRETVAKVREMFGADILYLEYEPETEKYGGDIHKKWADAISRVNTEYSHIVTDKEFLNPSGLVYCITYLKENPEYTIVDCGDYTLSLDQNGCYIVSSWQGDSSIEFSDLETRLSFYLNYSGVPIGTQFSTYKTTIHKKIFENMLKYDILDLRYGETAIELQPLLYGKFKKNTMIIGNIRDTINFRDEASKLVTQNKSESSYSRYPQFIDYPRKRKIYLQEQLSECFRDIVINSNTTNLNSDMNDVVGKLMEMRYLTKVSFINRFRPLCKVVQILWSKTRTKTKNKLRKILGQKILAQINMLEYPESYPEIKCILSVINITKKYHDSDSSII